MEFYLFCLWVGLIDLETHFNVNRFQSAIQALQYFLRKLSRRTFIAFFGSVHGMLCFCQVEPLFFHMHFHNLILQFDARQLLGLLVIVHLANWARVVLAHFKFLIVISPLSLNAYQSAPNTYSQTLWSHQRNVGLQLLLRVLTLPSLKNLFIIFSLLLICLNSHQPFWGQRTSLGQSALLYNLRLAL